MNAKPEHAHATVAPNTKTVSLMTDTTAAVMTAVATAAAPVQENENHEIPIDPCISVICFHSFG
jgi:hypothetical protein